MDATAGEPSNFQSRFATDGSLWLRAYEQAKTKDDGADVIGDRSQKETVEVTEGGG